MNRIDNIETLKTIMMEDIEHNETIRNIGAGSWGIFNSELNINRLFIYLSNDRTKIEKIAISFGTEGHMKEWLKVVLKDSLNCLSDDFKIIHKETYEVRKMLDNMTF